MERALLHVSSSKLWWIESTDIYVGWPGKVHDAHVFTNSALSQKGHSGTLFPRASWQHIQGKDIPVLVLASAR